MTYELYLKKEMGEEIEVTFDCVRCGLNEAVVVDLDTVQTKASEQRDFVEFAGEVAPSLSPQMGSLIFTYVVAMIEIHRMTDWDSETEPEHRCPECGRPYEPDDLPPEDDPAFHLQPA